MQRLPFLYFAESAIAGRGVFTGQTIEEGALIEICPVIVLPPQDLPVIHGTVLHDYYFLWGPDQKQGAIVLGFGSLYNHSHQPNAEFVLDYEKQTLDFYSLRRIAAGEEITITYNGLPGDFRAVWFEKGE